MLTHRIDGALCGRLFSPFSLANSTTFLIPTTLIWMINFSIAREINPIQLLGLRSHTLSVINIEWFYGLFKVAVKTKAV